jgi:S1-C subfamily serine protease
MAIMGSSRFGSLSKATSGAAICFRHMIMCFMMLLITTATMRGDQIPPYYYQTVIAIGRTVPAVPGQPRVWVTEASGFIYGYLIKDDPDQAKKKYATFIVTNRHVLAGHDKIEVRLDPGQANSLPRSVPVPLKDKQEKDIWYSLSDPNVDIGIIPVDTNWAKSQNLESSFILSDLQANDKAKLKEAGNSAGDTVYILGFPMGITGIDHNYVITRKGSIARISDFLAGSQSTFLIDAMIFPGNSGGPVFSGLEPIAILGTKSPSHVVLIGVVRGFIPYTDVAVSQQTLRPRVTFEENSGLAEVIPVDQVNETIVEYLKLHPPDLGPEK